MISQNRGLLPPGNLRGALAACAVVWLGEVVVDIALLFLLPAFVSHFFYLLFAAVVVGGIVALDAHSIGRPEITGPPAVWWAGVVGLQTPILLYRPPWLWFGVAFVFQLPVLFAYVFQRPRFIWRAAHERAWTKQELSDPTNPFLDDSSE